jgi:excisionase family DNA binding protein
MASNIEKRMMTVYDVADLLGLHRVTVYEKVSRGEIPHVRIGRAIRFDREVLERWIAEQSTPVAVAS